MSSKSLRGVNIWKGHVQFSFIAAVCYLVTYAILAIFSVEQTLLYRLSLQYMFVIFHLSIPIMLQLF